MALLFPPKPAENPRDLYAMSPQKPSSEKRLRKLVARRSSILNPASKDSGSVHTAATEPIEDTSISNHSTTSNRSKKKGRVRFRKRLIGLADTLNRDDYTQEELDSAFFTDDDYEDITKDCCKQVAKMESGKVLKDKKYSSRGLEGHTLLGSVAKSENRMLSISLVLLEQERQRENDEEANQDLIALRYSQCTSSIRLWAHTIGLKDQREAESCDD